MGHTHQMNNSVSAITLEKVSVLEDTGERSPALTGYCIRSPEDFRQIQSMLRDGLGFLAVCESESLDGTFIYNKKDIIVETDPYLVSTQYAMICWQILAFDRMNRYLHVSKEDLEHEGGIIGREVVLSDEEQWPKKIICRLARCPDKFKITDPAKASLNRLLGDIEQTLQGQFNIDYINEAGFWNVIDQYLILPDSSLMEGYWGDLNAELDNRNRLVFVLFNSI